jgi:hypothetical protein
MTGRDELQAVLGLDNHDTTKAYRASIARHELEVCIWPVRLSTQALS